MKNFMLGKWQVEVTRGSNGWGKLKCSYVGEVLDWRSKPLKVRKYNLGWNGVRFAAGKELAAVKKYQPAFFAALCAKLGAGA